MSRNSSTSTNLRSSIELVNIRNPEVKAAMAIVVAFLIAGLVAAFARAPYLDEFWTMVFANPEIPVTLAWQMWSGDRGHPVLYMALMRFLSEIFGQGVLLGRLLNFLPLAFFLIVGALSCRIERARKFTIFFTILTLSLYFVVERFADQRSYFFAMMVLGSIIILIRLGFEESSRNVHLPLLLLSILLGFIHYSIALAGIAVLTSATISHFCAGRRSQMIWAAGAALTLLGAIAFSYFNGLGYEEIPPPYYVTMANFTLMLGVTLSIAALANPVLSWLSLQTLSKTAISGWREPLTMYWGCIAMALIFAILGYTLLNFFLHILLARQLMAVSMIAVALIGALVAESNLRGTLWPVVLASCTSLAVSTTLVARQENFFAAVPLLAERQAACETYRIFARYPDEIIDFPAKENARQQHLAIRLGYSHAATTKGLRLQTDQSQGFFDTNCGAAVWIQHFYAMPDTDPVALLEKLALGIPDRYAARAELIELHGAVIIHIPREAHEGHK